MAFEATDGSDGGVGALSMRCRVVEKAVAGAFQLRVEELRAPTRRGKETARARQLAMYLAHVGLGLDYSTVGRMFGRDRTTVRHACAVIEDARDDRAMDQALDGLEHAILARIDHVAFGQNRPNAKNVIDSKDLEHCSSEKPVPTFSRNALEACAAAASGRPA